VKIVVIVEGDGEVEAVPLLIRRIGSEVSPLVPLVVPKPIRIRRNRIMRGANWNVMWLAAVRAGKGGRIMILLDANGDCPAELAPIILQHARETRPDLQVEVVLAKCEFEAWFISAIESVAGTRGIHPDRSAPADPELIRGAKEWYCVHCPKEWLRTGGTYRPTADQTALTARFDMALARKRSPSFDKMWRATSELLR